MCGLEAYVRELGKINNAVIANSVRKTRCARKAAILTAVVRANYRCPAPTVLPRPPSTFPVRCGKVIRGPTARPAASSSRSCTTTWSAGVEIRLATPALQLIADPATREVRGVRVSTHGVQRDLEAPRCRLPAALEGTLPT
jgi:hypothetical protein